MTTIAKPHIDTATETQETQPVVLDGFIEPDGVSTEAPHNMFVVMPGESDPTPLYVLLHNERVHVPPQFIGQVLGLEIVERTYSQGYAPVTKLKLLLLIGNERYYLWLGLNAWAGISCLNALAQLDATQLQQALMFKVVVGKRCCFINVSVNERHTWHTVEVPEEQASTRPAEDELILMAGAVTELLESGN